MQSNLGLHDATLAAIALIEAYMAGDREAVDAVLADQADHTLILQQLLAVMESFLRAASGGDPSRVLGRLRAAVVASIAEKGQQ